MKRSNLSKVCLVAILATVPLSDSASAQSDGNNRMSVTVAFGAGLNTAPTSPANHHILPTTIEVKAGGVVNFAVAGFHEIFVYNPGKRLEDVILTGGTPLLINDLSDLYYQGIVPAGGPLANPVTTNPSNASNRVESVAFLEPGTYLVICNIRPHFNNGMYAFVKVSG